MIIHLKQVLDLTFLKPVKNRIDEAYADLPKQFILDNHPNEMLFHNGGKYVNQVASFTIKAVLGAEKSMNILNTILNIDEVKKILPVSFYLNLDQIWIRTQFPLQHRKHLPHTWHQDGALAFPFMDPNANYVKGLIDMRVLWIPFTDAGLEAPGLEFIDNSVDRVFTTAELDSDMLKKRFSQEKFLKPFISVGDVIAFDGSVLHRTWVNQSMTKKRVSMGIRVFSSIPQRLKADFFVKFR